MFSLFLDSVRLFLRGKLFRDPGAVAMKAAIGAGIAAMVCLALALAGLPTWLAVVIASLAAGGVQPWLFKDLRYQ